MKKLIVVLLSIFVLLSVPAFANHDQGNGNSQDHGPQGEQGPPGQDGEPGPPGADGQDGINGVDGMDGVDGKDGSDANCRKEFGYGIGADVIIFKSANPIFSRISVDTRYDIKNRETKVFGVVTVDLWDAISK